MHNRYPCLIVTLSMTSTRVEWPAQARDRRGSSAASRLDRRTRVAASCLLRPSADR
jgi:hypothetical protein